MTSSPRATGRNRAATHGESVDHGLAAWLQSRSDDELVALLRARPDLALAPPANLTVLAARAQQRASVQRAADDLDTLDMAVIEALGVAGAFASPVPRRVVHDAVAGRASAAAVDARIDHLRDLALVWGDDALATSAALPDALPWRGLRLVPQSDGELRRDVIDQRLAGLQPGERALLDALAQGSPVGRTRDAAPGTPADRPVQRLLAAGLLHWVDDNTVELPHPVRQALRGEPELPDLAEPDVARTKHDRGDVESASGGEALELLRHVDDVIGALGAAPAVALRSGGLGVREQRRLAKATGLDEARVGLVLELLRGAELLALGRPEPAPLGGATDEFWAAVVGVEPWIERPAPARWAALASVWLALPRRPWLIGRRDSADKAIAALSDDVQAPAAVLERRLVLETLAHLGHGVSVGPEALVRLAQWRRPRRAARITTTIVEQTLTEAAAVGLVGRGALTGAGRALLGGDDPQPAMAAALPDPVDHVLVQADLTVVAPGPLVPDLGRRIGLVADVESAGAATVYRITEDSVRRALDVGLSSAELHSLFATHSRTPVPQALDYLIDDVARRHGLLRAGVASSFVRCDDPSLLTEVLASPAAARVALRALAPTVAVSPAPLADVLDELRAAGYAPAGEDSSGAIVDLRPAGARIPVRRRTDRRTRPAGAGTPPSAEQLAGVVEHLRAGDRAATASPAERIRSDGTRAGIAKTMALLQLAARVGRSVSVGYVDAQGTKSERIVEPVAVRGGQLDARDPVTGSLAQFTLHRVTSVALLD